MNRDKKLKLIRRIFYSSTSETAWFEILVRYCQPDHSVCEIGSGSGDGSQNKLYPNVSSITGVDVDERVLTNKFLTKAHVGPAEKLFEIVSGETFDVIYSHMTAEHIENPANFIEQQIACLKKGGIIFHSTVSKFYWTSIINDFVPESIKNCLISAIGSGRNSDEIFPAFYKLNTKYDIRALAKTYNLECEIIRSDQAPGYLRRSFILMLIYTIIHRPIQFILPQLRPTFIFILRRAE